MREIKIRIFDKKNKKMLELYTLFINERMFKPVGGDEYSVWNYDTEYYSNPMQYTGLKDKNGVEIYEGDILSHHLQGNRFVEYGSPFKNYGGYMLVSKNGMRGTLNDSDKLYEVIGNIYENKELLNTDG